MADDINEGKQRTLTAEFTKKDGSAGTVEGKPVWELSDAALATLVPAEDGMSAKVQHNGAVGPVDWTMTADGDLGIGVFPIVKTDTFNMLAPFGAEGGTVTVGPEEPIA
ncbi:hypothetical protein BH20PSE1_BH20PSE1_01070 [soil metagenome]